MNASTITRSLRHRSAASLRLLPLITLTGSLAVGSVGLAAQAAQSSPGQRSVQDGVYTAEQAKRGQERFNGWGRCSVCHLENLEGDPQRQALPLVGAFLSRWSGHTVNELVYRTRYTMPAGLRGPNTLSAQDYSDLVAYIFQRNGLPAGQRELSTDSEQLERIMIGKGSGR